MARTETHRNNDVGPLRDLAETLGRLLRNTVFRLSLIGALLFGVSLLVAQGIVYDQIVSSELRRVDTSLKDELDKLQEVFNVGGDAAIQAAQKSGLLTDENFQELGRAVYDRGAFEVTSSYITEFRQFIPDNYTLLLLKDAVAGNLHSPSIRTQGIQASELEEFEGRGILQAQFEATVNKPGTEETEIRRVRAIGQNIYQDQTRVGVMFVGRDVENTISTGENMKSAMFVSSLIALFLGVLSSIFVARRFTARVDVLNRLANDVQAGNLDRRAPRNYSEDEMDRLAEHLNGMLDHIDRLMKAMRYAGDSVAHDLRTPLTRLRTRLETAAVEAGDTPEADVLYAAAGDADQLLSTFDSVLRIARLEAGERRELLKPLDPKPILDDLAELYEPACEDAGLRFTHDIPDGLMILADRGLLSQAVSNLVENAIKYAGGGGGTRIHLEACKSARGRTRISVSDDGPGIPIFDRERVKERFVRLDKSRTLPGSGLGLALVDAVAELHNAEFVLDDGLGADALADGREEDAVRPGLKGELVFPRVKAGQKPEKGEKAGKVEEIARVESLPEAAE